MGMVAIYRHEVGAFPTSKSSCWQNFAAQVVIAMENARLLTEQGEALEQQTATAEVLQVINASPGNLAPVFDAMLEKAMRLCGAAFGSFYTFDGEQFLFAAERGSPEAFAEFGPRPREARAWQSTGPSHREQADITSSISRPRSCTLEVMPSSAPWSSLGACAPSWWCRCAKTRPVLGFLSVYRQEVRAFSDKQIALLESFAAQAVIAMENARLLHELRARTDDSHNAKPNCASRSRTWATASPCLTKRHASSRGTANSKTSSMCRTMPWRRVGRSMSISATSPNAASIGPNADPDEQVLRLHATRGQAAVFERTRPNGRIIEVRRNPIPGGGFVLIFSDITERKRSEAEIRAARDAAEEASRTIETAFRELKAAQANLIQAEKMASLGQLTAGIAHEIKNPLNFVNNFAILSVELLNELKETVAPGSDALDDDQRADVEEVVGMLTSNLEKITEHGKRADGIVKAMLEHSRGASGERRMVDLNTLADEALNLAYHGARAHDKSFSITLECDFGDRIAPIEVNPQDMTRVFLNLFSNGFYAANKRARSSAGPNWSRCSRHDPRPRRCCGSPREGQWHRHPR